MGFIKEKVELVGTLKRKSIMALFDSGAYQNYTKRVLTDGENIEDIGFHTFEGTQNVILANETIASGEKVRFKEVRIKGYKVNDPQFVIMDNLLEDMIIGASLMQKLGIQLDPPNEKINIASK